MPQKQFTSILLDKERVKECMIYGVNTINDDKTEKRKQSNVSIRTLQSFFAIVDKTLQKNVEFFYHDLLKKISKRKLPTNITYSHKEKWYNCIFSCYGLKAKDDSIINDFEDNPEENIMTIALMDDYLEIIKKCSEGYTTQNSYIEELVGDDKVGNKKRFIESCIERNVIKFEKGNNKADYKKKYTLSENIFDNSDICKNEIFLNLYHFVDFMSEFTCLSVLGYYFRNSLKKYCIKKNFLNEKDFETKFILTKGVNPDIVLAQEGVFRVLKAIYEKRYVFVDNHLYLPLRAFYTEKTKLDGTQYPYAEMLDPEREKLVIFDLCKNYVITVGEELCSEPTIKASIDQITHRFRVEFFINDENMPYLYKEIEKGKEWKDESKPDSEYSNDIEELDTPYYGKIECIKKVIRYTIPETDKSKFLEWIRSFGDFAYIVEPNSFDVFEYNAVVIEDDDTAEGSTEVKDVEFQNALFNPYNSKGLFYKTDLSLPPTNLEVFWLKFVMENYQNIVKMFFNETQIKKIKVVINEYCETQKGKFNPFNCLKYKIADTTEALAPELKTYIQIILNSSYEFSINDENRECECIFPYSLDFNCDDNSFRMMVYDISGKRIKAINPLIIPQKNDENNPQLTYVDKLYFFCCAIEKTIINSKKSFDNNFVTELLGRIEINGNAYGRITNSDGLNFIVNDLFDKVKALQNKQIDKWIRYNFFKAANEEIIETFKSVYMYINKINVREVWDETLKPFSYYFKMFDGEYENCQFVQKTKKDGVAPFSINELRQKTNILLLIASAITNNNDTLEKIVENLSDEFIKETISEETVYSATNLKETTVTLKLKDGIEFSNKILERIYQTFGHYNCICDFQNANEIKFIIIYERFNFRKIHKLILALSDIVEVLEPDETKAVIEKRICNMKKNYKI